jgi:hypothetical protein
MPRPYETVTFSLFEVFFGSPSALMAALHSLLIAALAQSSARSIAFDSLLPLRNPQHCFDSLLIAAFDSWLPLPQSSARRTVFTLFYFKLTWRGAALWSMGAI